MTRRVGVSLPGHVYANVRQPPISTLNLAHMMPFSAVWAGPERDEKHFRAPPLFFARTEGSTPFRFSLHVGDVGHTLIVGPTGAGKSVLLALMALQFRRYEAAQVFAFDFGGSIRAAALAMHGDWHDLGGSLADEATEPVALQPLARVNDAGERVWASEWVAALLGRESVTITPELKEHLWSALTSLASAPVSERTITGLSVLLQSNALKQALRPYTVAGPWGRLLDAETERLGEGAIQAFETEGLIGAGAAPAVLGYLFHRIEDRLDGRPTLLIVDEGWLALDDPGFAGQLREWLKTLRKKNASVIFATQSLADIDGSSIAPAIIESCATAWKPPEISYDDTPLARDPPKPVRIVEVPKLLPLPGQLKPIPGATTAAPEAADPRARVELANGEARVQPTRAGYINAIQVYPFSDGALYQVYAAPGEITDESGTGASRQVHILIKPTRPDLVSNLIINTDRRTYHLELRSAEKT